MSWATLPQFSEDSRAQAASFVAPGEVTVSDQETSRGDGSSLSEWARTAASLQTDRVGDFRQEIFEQARVLARVGSEVILAGEILGAVTEILLPYQDKIPVVVYEQYKQQLMRQLLKKRIEMKLVYEDIKRKIPRENLERIEQEIAKFFEEKEIPARLRKMGLQSAKEWDERLRSVGSSLEHEKRAFIEGTLARDWIKQQLTSASSMARTLSPEVLWEYYRTHMKEFEQPAEVRWQQLMVRKRPDRSDAEAYAKLAELGNRVLRGEPFEEVARSGSEGPTASEGGEREPVQPGSLRSRVLEEALFSLPVGQLSPILEDEQGFHIVRVLERREASRIPFTEAQVRIRERLAEEEKEKQLNEYLAKLRAEIPVWNIYEAPTEDSRLFPASGQGNSAP
ncbi:peptidylprolyl isomerase [Thermogutta sp.]|uniref:peptidylprolyl isomerase n=1 Tax=Thermogutta sp. TaxID=1962930 RepID=UPI003C7A2BD2